MPEDDFQVIPLGMAMLPDSIPYFSLPQLCHVLCCLIRSIDSMQSIESATLAAGPFTLALISEHFDWTEVTG